MEGRPSQLDRLIATFPGDTTLCKERHKPGTNPDTNPGIKPLFLEPFSPRSLDPLTGGSLGDLCERKVGKFGLFRRVPLGTGERGWTRFEGRMKSSKGLGREGYVWVVFRGVGNYKRVRVGLRERGVS
jgi:hypothetical protein